LKELFDDFQNYFKYNQTITTVDENILDYLHGCYENNIKINIHTINKDYKTEGILVYINYLNECIDKKTFKPK